jgi:uncharacterized membrane protein YeaQ/YmgE (transglycosylase-associated protein family)
MLTRWSGRHETGLLSTAARVRFATSKVIYEGDNKVINIIGWIIVGFITGLIARAVVPGADGMGFIMTTLLGIGGSFAGGFIGGMFTKEKDMMKPTPAGFIMSVVGAIAIIIIARIVT